MSLNTSFNHLDTLYIEHHRWLQGWLSNKVGCTFLAADLTQDTFVRLLLKQLENYHFTTPRAYLLHIAKGLLVDHWRRQTLEREYLEALATQEEVVVQSVELQAMMIETLIEIDAMLEKLPFKVRHAFLLAQMDGLTYKEISEVVGVSERMVKKYMSTAMLHCLQFRLSFEN